MNLGAMAAPASDVPLTDEALLQAVHAESAQAMHQSMLPPLRNPGTQYEVDTDDPLEHMSPAEIEAELLERAEARRIGDLRARLAAERAKDREIAEARAAIPASDPVRDSAQTWILMPESEPEAALCEEWVAEHCPVKIAQGAIVQTLDLAQLRPDDSVICMVRGKDKRRPLTRMEITVVQGENISTERPTEELLSQMVLTRPVFCKDHWVMGGPAGMGRAGGRLNYATFLEAIGKLCTPLSPRRLDSNSCKGSDEARMLVLREL